MASESWKGERTSRKAARLACCPKCGAEPNRMCMEEGYESDINHVERHEQALKAGVSSIAEVEELNGVWEDRGDLWQ